MHQTTIKQSIRARGRAALSGQDVNIRLKPGNANCGVVFQRVDLSSKPKISAKLVHASVSSSLVVSENGASVEGVTCLLAALYGLGIDNIVVEVDGPEMPWMQGCVSPYIFLIESAGVRTLPVAKKTAVLKDPVLFSAESRWLRCLPHKGIRIASWGNEYYAQRVTPVFELHRSRFVTEIGSVVCTPTPSWCEPQPVREFNAQDSKVRVVETLAVMCLLGCFLNTTIVAFNANQAITLAHFIELQQSGTKIDFIPRERRLSCA